MEISHRQDILEAFSENKKVIREEMKRSSNLFNFLQTSMQSIVKLMVT